MAKLPELSEMMDSGLREGVFPGGVLLVQRGASVVHLSAHGRSSFEPGAGRVTSKTCFDLASLTKVLSTAPLVLLAVRRGEVRLQDPVCQYIPTFVGDGRARIEISHLLEHSSGLAAWRPYYEEVVASGGGALVATAEGLEAVRGMVAAERPGVGPGERAEYSDLGFILLDWIIEKACGKSCDSLFAQRVARPLGLTEVFFVDLKSSRRAARARRGRRFAATERCPWRGRVLCGEVHDDNAYVMGGVSGHAGLFGTASGVAQLARAWLEAFCGREGLFPPDLARIFRRRSRVPGSTRTLGFDTPSPDGSQAGGRMGPNTVGHLGLTGTSLWIDPDRELCVVLLTNRVHPSRDNEAISEFRPGLHDAVAELVELERK